MSSQYHIHYQNQPMTTRDYAISVLDVITDVATYVFKFCVRNYKKKIQPVVYPVYRATADYTITWIDPGHWNVNSKYF